MALAQTQPAGGDGVDDDAAATAAAAATPVDATDYVRPGTGVVRPGTGVVRPGTGVVRPPAAAGVTDATAKARAVVPDAPEEPLEPIHVVLPIIPVKPAKQGLLDRLVAPKAKKPKKSRSAEGRDEETAPEGPAEDGFAGDAEDLVKPPEQPPQAQAPPAQPPHAHSPHARPAQVFAVPPAHPGSRPRQDASPWEGSPSTGRQWEAVVPPPVAVPPPAVPPATVPPPVAVPPPAPTRYRRARQPERDGARHTPLPDRVPAGDQRGLEPAGWPEDAADQPAVLLLYRRLLQQRRWVVVAAAAVVLVLVVAVAVVGRLASRPAPASLWQDPDTGTAAPVLAGLGPDAARPSTQALTALLQPLLADARLGTHVTASVVDVASGESVFDHEGAAAVKPASAAKLLTAAAVLHARGPAYRIPTRVVAGSAPGEVVLVGGGDPTLASGVHTAYPGAARLDILAGQVAKTLGGQTPTRVVVDVAAYSGPTLSPNWFASDAVDGYIANITALMADGARKDPRKVRNPSPRFAQPDLAAGQSFAAALGVPATAVVVAAGAAPAGATVLGEVRSPSVARMVEMMLLDSDNIIAEAMARQVAMVRGKPASFEGGAQATREVLAELGLPLDGLLLVDGSGLAHDDRVTARILTAVLAKAASRDFPQLRPIVSGLPVAHYSGTLAERYAGSGVGDTAAGTVRAKTGTLTGVNTLAGLVVDADGRLLAFSLVADATAKAAVAEAALDRVAAAIASCGCG